MPRVTYNGQSFAIDRRRIWVLGASLQYARITSEQWGDRIAAARQAGFNTIETACPWLIHEPRIGRFEFQGDCDVRRFIELCDEQRMMVILRPGPYVGEEFDGGGLPAWLGEIPDLKLREANEAFLERVTRYFRKLLSDLTDLQATRGGPILLVQAEHGWRCSNPHQAQRYLHEITRIIRESGIAVPILSADDLWSEAPDTIDVWTGWDELLPQLRQLRTLQGDAPRLVNLFNPDLINTWGHAQQAEGVAAALSRRLAEVLAAGAQPIVRPFHGGTNFGFLAGRVCGSGDGFVATSPAPEAPLAEAGTRTDTFNAIRRVTTFANNFGHLFAELHSDYHPITLDLGEPGSDTGEEGTRPRSQASGGRWSLVPLRGSLGRVVFVFGSAGVSRTTLVLDDGLRLPVDLGDQSVGWFVMDADLGGSGRLDYANLCPWAIVDRSVVVLHGPARMNAYLSVNGSPLEATVPAGRPPLVLEHKSITFVICNQSQIDLTYHDGKAVYVGVSGLDSSGEPIPAPGFTKAWKIQRDGQQETLTLEAAAPQPRGGSSRRGAASIEIGEWEAAPAVDHTTGQSPRFASLAGPQTLPACGAMSGYGWYRIAFRISAAKKRMCQMPQAADRVHLFLDGETVCLWGAGRGAEDAPFELRLSKGEHTLVALADNLGRFADGNDLARGTGLFGHLYEVKAIRGARPKTVTAEPVDPFTLRAYIAGCAKGQLSANEQVAWQFTHAKKTPILVEVIGATSSGTFVLNDQPIDYYAGVTGACRQSILMDPRELAPFKRGRNELRFAPDARQKNAAADIVKATKLYECVDRISDPADWAFGKWEMPSSSSFEPVSRTEARSIRGTPCWWRASFEAADLPLPAWFDTIGLSKGQAYVNGRNLGRYFTSTAAGRAVGPQKRLYVPETWLNRDRPNELMIFDEHGFAPSRTKIVLSDRGELE
ncbi:MAG: beta-galactosidase [Phycisphaerales bacterium]|nr:MAG: beta-galactosidase [Phycisphaerales bacterium]